MGDEVKVKILLIGPCKVGKTVIGNFLSEITQSLNVEYHPTVALR